MKIYSLIALLSISTILMSCKDSQETTENRLDELYELFIENRTAWNERNDLNYDFQYVVSCFCAITGSYTISVRDDSISEIFNNNTGEYLSEDTFDYFYTINALYEEIDEAFENEQQLELSFDDSLNYPTLVVIDRDLMPVDGGVYIEVNDLVIF